jgi:pyridoxamine 5'-phosphate oxidase
VVPDLIEFWYGAPYRLHDRHRYELIDGEWRKRLLYP